MCGNAPLHPFHECEGTFEPPGLFRLPALDDLPAEESPIVRAAYMVHATQASVAASDENSAAMTPLILSNAHRVRDFQLEGLLVLLRFSSRCAIFVDKTWVTPPSMGTHGRYPLIYSVWMLTSITSTDSFADAVNESRCIPCFRSADPLDACFAAISAREEVEARTAAGGANPPFSSLPVRKIISTFDAGVHGGSPYCCCVIPALGKKFVVMKHLTDCITNC
jgi:hypothetical protein